ncbi:hypothetical protein HMI54_009666 [Coelomomyces lativittatus]|nr:hypothetical protein HMI54_009666 [Coelomomyces lativittatus]KAJ1503624.1 hypothetical protein HMI56_002042 [Coelomomyces lativittatus]KAJ1508844.1 hypothetical protein HMI55_000197 [Coelomomyces lativittatus]
MLGGRRPFFPFPLPFLPNDPRLQFLNRPPPPRNQSSPTPMEAVPNSPTVPSPTSKTPTEPSSSSSSVSQFLSSSTTKVEIINSNPPESVCPFVMKNNYYVSNNETAIPFRNIAVGWKTWCTKEGMSDTDCQNVSNILVGLGNNSYSLQGCLGISLDAPQFIWLCHDAIYKQLAAGPIGPSAIPQLCMNFGNFREHCTDQFNAELVLNASNRKGFSPYLHGCISNANRQQCAWLVPINLSPNPVTLDNLISYRTCATRPFTLNSLSTGSSSLFSASDMFNGTPDSSSTNKSSSLDVQTLSLTIAGGVFVVIMLVSGVLFYRKKKRSIPPSAIDHLPAKSSPASPMPPAPISMPVAPPRSVYFKASPAGYPKPTTPVPNYTATHTNARASVLNTSSSVFPSHVSQFSNDIKPDSSIPSIPSVILSPSVPPVWASPPVLPVLQRGSISSNIELPASHRRTVLTDVSFANADSTIKTRNVHF